MTADFPEIWASPEPTIARINHDTYRNQLHETGHAARESDIDLLASLDITATRYPVLWEATAPHDPERCDLRWAERRLTLLRDAGIEPIVTLLHHGSGPRYTELIDQNFPSLFERYAAIVAAKFPWIKRWTPINEPLTTARFSTMYATWYPNRSFDHTAFGRAIVNETRGIARAMRAIRGVIPGAEMILTEDLQGFTADDRGVSAYVEYKRERSFLSVELLMGRVVPGHSLYRYLRETCNVTPAELAELSDDPVPPSMMGYNYYPLSERIVRSDPGGGLPLNDGMVDFDPSALDMKPLLRAAYERLGLPLGLTEIHTIGSDRERARWMLQRFHDVAALRGSVDIRAFAPWAAFGLVDWMSCLRRRDNCFEDGIFTFAGAESEPQRTLVADVVRGLANGTVLDMPAEPGWWERDRSEAVA